MGKVGTCLVTLAGLLLAAGAETFTGKESAEAARGRPAFPGARRRRAGGARILERRRGFGLGFCLFLYISSFFYYYFF